MSQKNLPPELWRKGRYDEVFFVDLPSVEEREDIFRIHLEKRAQNTMRLNLRELAQNSNGFTGAEIEQAAKDAIVATFNMLHSGKESKDADALVESLTCLNLSQAQILSSIRNITPLSVLKKEEIEALRNWSHQRARPASKSLFMQRAEMLSHAEKRAIAIHEAGHSLVMWHHFKKTPVFISIDNYKDYSAYITIDETLISTFTKRDLEKEIGTILGGMVAEDEISGNDSKTVGASHDLTKATAIARKMVVEYGFGEIIKNTSLVELQDYVLTSSKEIMDDIQKILDNAKAETEAVISRNKETLMKLVDKFAKDILMNSDGLNKFFNENPLS